MQEPALTGLCSRKQAGRPRVPRIIGKARIQRRMSAHEDPWHDVLDVHPTAHRPDCLTGHAWLQLPDRICEVHRGLLEFWYDAPGCALTDEESLSYAGWPRQASQCSSKPTTALSERIARSIAAWIRSGSCVRRAGLCARRGPRDRGSAAIHAGATRPLKHLSRNPAEGLELIGGL